MKQQTITVLILFALVFFAQSTVAQHKANCGHSHYMNLLERQHPGISERINEGYLQSIDQKNTLKSSQSTSIINVVFHIVNRFPSNDISDEVINYQLEQLNKDFNRQNENASDTRAIYSPIAGAMDIRFQLAEIDPLGNPTTGINRYSIDFDLLPEITLADIQSALDECDLDISDIDPLDPDSCYIEALYGDLDIDRIKKSGQGGIDPWDVDKYVNIWIGDLSLTILGQKIPFLLGFAYPPYGVFDELDAEFTESELRAVDGIVLHYEAVGPDNPLNIGFLQGFYDRGRTLVHEMGHYLGLRHVWGDGDCSFDDFIEDTPPMGTPANATLTDTFQVCEVLDALDTCIEDDFPDMFENYMNYSTGKCQNMFTQEQVELMDFILNNQRQSLLEGSSAIGNQNISVLSIYPNPVTDELHLDIPSDSNSDIIIFNSDGQQVLTSNTAKISIAQLPSGVYLIQLKNKDKVSLGKVIKL